MSFAFWLGKALDQAGYVSLPAQSTRSAVDLLDCNDVFLEVAVIEASLPDAAFFATGLHKSYPLIKTAAALPENGAEVSALAAYDAHRRKPSPRDGSAEAAWVNFIRSLSPPRPARAIA